MSGAFAKSAEVDTVAQTLTIDGEPFPYAILRAEGAIIVHADAGNIPTIVVTIPVESISTHC